MPLFKVKSFKSHMHYIVWQISETEEELRREIKLYPTDHARLEKLKHPEKIKEFLALRCCLRHFFGENPEICYTPNGKPFLKNGPSVSFSHTSGFAGVAIGEGLDVGLDLEIHRESIQRIAPKFMREDENITLDPDHLTAHITYYWGAKEVLVKIEGDRKLHFKKQLRISPFLYRNHAYTTAVLSNGANLRKYQLYFEKHENLYLTYGWKVN
ncbi:MAG: 4'-phosphopantetheinyl transferase family protein [Owenweeksia sp.]